VATQLCWEPVVIQFYNETDYNMHRLNLLGWDLHTYDADVGAPDKVFFTHDLLMCTLALINRSIPVTQDKHRLNGKELILNLPNEAE
jgi:hypothetical protein